MIDLNNLFTVLRKNGDIVLYDDTKELFEVLVEYLDYSSTDGKPIRQELRKKLKELINYD